MTIEVPIYPIMGISGPHKSVSLWHTNKNLMNFHFDVDITMRKVYDTWEDGKYTFVAGYQNGRDELGISHIIVKTTMESGQAGNAADC